MPAGYSAPRPDLNAPSGLDPGTQDYLAHARAIDPSISEAQYMHPEWRQAYDPSGCPPNTPFRSTKVGGDNACVEKPDNCPPGKQAFGANECRDSGEVARITAQQAAGRAGSPAAAAPAAPAQPRTLQDVLMQMFGQRAGIFGMQAGRNPLAQQLAGQFSVDQFGNPLPQAPNLAGKALSGGGLVWGGAGTDLSGFNTPGSAPAAAAGTRGGGSSGAPDWMQGMAQGGDVASMPGLMDWPAPRIPGGGGVPPTGAGGEPTLAGAIAGQKKKWTRVPGSGIKSPWGALGTDVQAL